MMRRNLFYSVYATQHTDEWVDNVCKLRTFEHVFNGRRIIVVRTDGTTVDPSEVESLFAGFNAEFIHRWNNPELGETEGFLEDFGRLFSYGKYETTFYAHTKGAKYEATDPKLPMIRAWRNALYEGSLSDIARVDAALDISACAGCFKSEIVRRDFNAENWHYAGNFWWVNNNALFSRDWQKIRKHRNGVECWPALIFKHHEAYALSGQRDFEELIKRSSTCS